VPAVFPKMSRDAVRSGRFANARRFNWIGFSVCEPPVTRFPEGRYVIDVHSKLHHFIFSLLRLF
jgi:hypothetical protein